MGAAAAIDGDPATAWQTPETVVQGHSLTGTAPQPVTVDHLDLTVFADGRPVGELSSAGYSPLGGACVALAYLRGAGANRPHAGTPLEVDLWGRRVAAQAWDRWPAR